MIIIKSDREIELMRSIGRITARILREAGLEIRPGISTQEVDSLIRRAIAREGVMSSTVGYHGFPGACCVSINEEVIHGIPDKNRIIREGDLVKVDLTCNKDGYHGDCSRFFFAGKGPENAEKLAEVTRQSFYEGIQYAREGCRVSDISSAIERYVTRFGYTPVRKFIGHGIGADMHEDPEVPNFGEPGKGPRLRAGMTLAIEPMINEGTHEVSILRDGWTVVTNDGKLSAHYENTVLITEGDPVILTDPGPD